MQVLFATAIQLGWGSVFGFVSLGCGRANRRAGFCVLSSVFGFASPERGRGNRRAGFVDQGSRFTPGRC